MTIVLDPVSNTVTMSRAEYEALREAAEDAEDLAHLAVQEERERLLGVDSVRADALPVALVERMLDGESPVRIWREHRGLTIAELAPKAALEPGRIEDIEAGNTPATADELQALARILAVTADDLAP
jgi:ribosome-binding protein aMBF1 (putative translation factor)